MRRVLSVLVIVLAGCEAAPRRPMTPPAKAQHPLDPLTAGEIQEAMRLLRASGNLPEGAFIPLLVLHEPAKGEATPPREAFAMVLDRPKNSKFEAVVDLMKGEVRSWKRVVMVQPPILFEEFERVPDLVREDPTWQAAMRKRGITKYEDVLIDTWAPGAAPHPHGADVRMARAIAFHRGDSPNAYGRPIEGVVALVDLNKMTVVRVEDTGVRPVTRAHHDYLNVTPRAGTRPLRVVQPEGASFAIDGHEVRWQKWVFRYALHPREGIVLNAVGYEDEGRVRPILHRASISEMVVPYGDPDWAWRNAFDEGEYGLGRNANSLRAGHEVPENAALADAVIADETGAPHTLERAIAFYERDGGILWSHYNDETELTETRRARQLVVACTVTIGNYDYMLSWIFHQDGTLEAEALATGILLAKGTTTKACGACPDLAAGRSARGPGDEASGTLVAEEIVAPNHQHFFSYRLDFDVDGPVNTAAEMNARALEERTGFAVDVSVLPSELKARRDMSLADHRSWKVFNPSSRRPLGHLAGYMLLPGENAVPHVRADALTRKRWAFVDHHVWFTRYKPDEMSAAGPYPNQHEGGEGLPKWTEDDEPLVSQDVVLWYTVGLTHLPRPEEWPIMPAAKAGFKLVPAAFFAKNPALDVPREK